MTGRKKVLWLVSWYPNKYDLFDGDFIQRHAKAAALYDNIHVLFVKTSDQQQTAETERKEENGLVEEIIYLPTRNSRLGKISSYIQWQKAFRSATKAIIEEEKPDLVHVHIPWKAGLIALWVKRKFNIPFLLTEHWGIYNSIVEDNIYTKPFIVRYFLKKIYKEASSFISVSRFLGNGVNETLVKKEFHVIPNVVDNGLFYPSKEKYERFTFLHVSNMVPLKNVEGILQAFTSFDQIKKGNAHLLMIGNRNNKYELLAQKLGLTKDAVTFSGELPYSEVAEAMKRSHIFILNSNIENSPCVIGEALCCGLSVIATNVGGITELVNKENSVLIQKGDTGSLTQAMLELYDRFSQCNRQEIALNAQNYFAPSVVGQQFHRLYASNQY